MANKEVGREEGAKITVGGESKEGRRKGEMECIEP